MLRILILALTTLLTVNAASPFAFRKSLSTGASSVAPSQPTEWWAFEDSITTGFEDRVGSKVGYILDPQNVRPHPSATGKIGNGIQSSSNGDLLSHASSFMSPSLPAYANTDWSISYWLKPTTMVGSFVGISEVHWSIYSNGGAHPTTSDSYIININLEDQDGSTGLYINDLVVLDLSDFSSTSYETVTNSHSGLNQWTHYVVAYEYATGLLTFYINGTFIGTSTMPGETLSGGSHIYFQFGMGDSSETVVADELGLWQAYYLTQANVTWLYNGGSGRTYTDIP